MIKQQQDYSLTLTKRELCLLEGVPIILPELERKLTQTNFKRVSTSNVRNIQNKIQAEPIGN
jgi:hypothetical protein